jgi:hypothetical protein
METEDEEQRREETGCRGGQGSPRAVAPKKSKKRFCSVPALMFSYTSVALHHRIEEGSTRGRPHSYPRKEKWSQPNKLLQELFRTLNTFQFPLEFKAYVEVWEPRHFPITILCILSDVESTRSNKWIAHSLNCHSNMPDIVKRLTLIFMTVW